MRIGYTSYPVAIAAHACRRLGILLLAYAMVASSGVHAGVHIAGPVSMMPAMKRMASHASEKTGMEWRVRTGEEASLIADVSRGKFPFAMVCRSLSDKERASVEAHLIGYDGIAVIVNGRNPVENLEAAQVAEIYAQRITRWKNVGGTDKQIVPVVKEKQTLPQGAAGNLFIPLHAPDKGVHVVNADLPAILFVAVDPYAISYVGITEATRLIAEGARIKVINIDGKLPAPELLRNGAYSLSWPVYLITSRRLNESGSRVKAFLLGLEGARALAEAGLVSARGDKP